MALSKLHLCALVWEARTDFGSVGAGRKSVLTQIDNFRQGLTQRPPPGAVDPTAHRPVCADRMGGAGVGPDSFLKVTT